jgi:aspartyl-tRNA(Asn)/glutamyl-tRNA(Gln) amidotransferase subunit A
MGKTVEDTALLLNYMAGHDVHDGTSSPQPVPDFTATLGAKDLRGLKIGVMYLDLPGLESVREHYQTTLDTLRQLGAEVELVSALDPHYAISVYTIIQRGEVSSNLARFDGIRYGNDRSFFGDEAQRRIMLGTYTLSKGYADQYYVLAQKVRTLFRQDFERLFAQYDLLVAPSTPSFAEKVGASGQSSMFGELADILAEPSSITGLPGISVPCYHDKTTNLYLGLNIMAPMWREDLMIKAADAFEQVTPWNNWRHHDH